MRRRPPARRRPPPDSGDSADDTDSGVDDTATDPAFGSPECPPDHASHDIGSLAPPPLVIVVTLDALHRGYLGRNQGEWNTSPRIDRLLEDSTVLQNVLVPRGLTLPSLATLVIGDYPRTHGVRDNDGSVPAGEMLQERFQSAGWQTIGALGNQCSLLERGFETTLCTSPFESGGGESSPATDRQLVQYVLDGLDARDTTRSTYAWGHLMSVHDPYDSVDRWFGEFHPERYEGVFDPPQETALNAVTLGALDFDEADRRFVDAVYASQLREVDAILAHLFDGLAERWLYDDAILVFGSDHGDALGLRESRYFWHGCSVYNPVLAATYGIRAPGRVSAGEVLDGWVSLTDLTPTVLELAGLDSTATDGTSLVSDIHACENPLRPPFFERAASTVGLGGLHGVIVEGRKFILNPLEGYAGCRPYSAESPYPGAAREMYDLVADPDETLDLSGTDPAGAAALKDTVCAWVNDGPWEGAEEDARNALRATCR